MATIINNPARTETREVREVPTERRSSAGVIIGVIILVLILLALFGGSLFRGGSSGGSTTQVNTPVGSGSATTGR